MKRTVWIAVALSLHTSTTEASMKLGNEPFRQRLIDVDRNLRTEEWSIGSGQLDLDTPHRWSIRKYVLHGGRQEGVDMIEVDNGTLSFKIAASRGMNLWDAHCEGMRVGWNSPVTEVVHPQFVNLDSRGGLGWLEGFGELMCRCGLVSNGAPGLDEVPSNTGALVKVQLTLHGKVSYIPARSVEVIIEPPPSRRIVVRGVVDETMMYGPSLRLTTEYSTVVGSKTVSIQDDVKNLAATPQEMELLYHWNFGRPLLGKGARFIAPLKRVTPRDARGAEGGMADWNVFGAPQPDYTEQVHFLRLLGDSQDNTEALLQNADGSRGVALNFSLKELPYMTLWKNTGAEENGYVTGLEPATNYPNFRSVERKHGRVPVLQGGESRRFRVDLTTLMSAADVKASARRIEALQGSVRTEVLTEPSED